MVLQIAYPEKGDKFFNTTAKGGISTCIVPPNSEPGLNTLPNCVAAAAGAFNKAACKDPENKPVWQYLKYPPDAGKKWIDRARGEGLRVDKIPEIGSVIVWGNRKNLEKGHVAFVYRVEGTTIYTAESEYNGRVWVNRKYTAPDYYYNADKIFMGFIHQPRKNRPVLKEGCRGADVARLQKLLADAGYMRQNEVDGDFGKITKGAVLCYQWDNGLEVDAVCGSETWSHIEK